MKLKINIREQPDDSTCGPTCLHSVYNYLDHPISLEDVINSVQKLDDGGTLAVMLAKDALMKGFNTTLYSYNLKIFDPTWALLSKDELIEKLKTQLLYKKGVKFTEASLAYIDYLELGGVISFENLTAKVIKKYISAGYPILTGLSATYLYQTAREFYPSNTKSVYDDLKGVPLGHFVVLTGVKGNHIFVADPYRENTFTRDHYYSVHIDRLLNAILLGIITYDANLLVIKPKDEKNRRRNKSKKFSFKY